MRQKAVVACLLRTEKGQPPAQTIRTFGDMTTDLLALADWRHTAGCTHVAMERTGVSCVRSTTGWKASCPPLVVNAQHMKAVPGRKTDVKDAEWIATRLSQPPRPRRELTRHRMTLVQDRARVINCLQTVLED